jgi:hypothetical protein
MTEQMLEILIGKFLDAEITPAEQQMLDDALEDDQQANDLFNQLKELHNINRQAVTTNIMEKGRPQEDIFEDAWSQKSSIPFISTIRDSGILKVAAVLAIGFFIGLTMQDNSNLTPEFNFGQNATQAAIFGTQPQNGKNIQSTMPMQTIRLILPEQIITDGTKNIDTELLRQINTQLKQMQQKLDKLESEQNNNK